MIRRLDFFLFLIAVLLSFFGVFVLYESSTYFATLTLDDKYYFVKNQAIWLVLGIAICILLSRINYRIYYKMALPGLIATILALLLVFFPGVGLELKGAHRWINLGFLVLQPSELFKITLAVYLAAWFSTHEKGRLPAFLMLLGASVLLVGLEPDLGTAFIIASTATIIYFISGARILEMAVIFLILALGTFLLIKIEPYRVARLVAFQNLDTQNLSKTSYHTKQILIALGLGGIGGLGFGNSIQKYGYLPESTTDSIFAIIAEEAGFIGGTILILAFAAFVTFGFVISARIKDNFGRLLGCGIIIFIGVQTFLNLASQTLLAPLTGVPLPFISYGGSSLVINFASLGILLNIANSRNKG